MTPPVRAYLALGSNVGDRLDHLAAAIRAIAGAPPPPAERGAPALAVDDVSAVYETTAIGVSGASAPDQPDFLNAVISVTTTLAPPELLRLTAGIEAALGRVRVERWGPRTIDIDLLVVGDERVDTPELQLPHPRLGERTFVLRPLLDLDPVLVLPDGRAAAACLAVLHGPPCRPHATAGRLRTLAGLSPAHD